MTIHTDRLSKEALDGIRERARQRVVLGSTAGGAPHIEEIHDDVLNLLIHADAWEAAGEELQKREATSERAELVVADGLIIKNRWGRTGVRFHDAFTTKEQGNGNQG